LPRLRLLAFLFLSFAAAMLLP